MTHQRYLIALALFLTSAASAFAAPNTIQFESESNLPYSEGGLSFSSIGSPPNIAHMSVTSGRLRSAGIDPENQHTRASSPVPFSLHSLDYRLSFSGPTSPWRIESSTGAVFLPTQQSGTPTVDLSAMPGWSNINYFDVIFDGPDVRHNFSVDNMVVEFIPEPSGIALGAMSLLGLSVIRRRS